MRGNGLIAIAAVSLGALALGAVAVTWVRDEAPRDGGSRPAAAPRAPSPQPTRTVAPAQTPHVPAATPAPGEPVGTQPPGDTNTTNTPATAGQKAPDVQTLPPFPAWPHEVRDPAFTNSVEDVAGYWMHGFGNKSRTAAEQENAFARVFYGGAAMKAFLDDFLPRARITGEVGAGVERLKGLWEMASGFEVFEGDPQVTKLLFVTSPIKDESALGGFGECLTNLPFATPAKVAARIPSGTPQGIGVVVLPDPATHRMTVTIANTGSEGVWLVARDSHPQFRHEHWDEAAGRWASWAGTGEEAFCGNSFHRVVLPAGQCWTAGGFAYARPAGMRERLVLVSGETEWVSNEFAMPASTKAPEGPANHAQ